MSGRILIALVGIVTTIGGYLADWNETHVLNPRWPPHAKFHNGQTMSMGAVLGLTTLYYLYGPPASPSNPLAQQASALRTAAWIASLYWITQLSAILYPGSLAVDPEFGEGFPQLWLDIGLLSMVSVGTVLENWKLKKLNADKRE